MGSFRRASAFEKESLRIFSVLVLRLLGFMVFVFENCMVEFGTGCVSP